MLSHTYSLFPSHERFHSRNVSLAPKAAADAAATVAIKRQQQVADDGVPPPSHNARVQLHQDEYASRRIDEACDSRLIIFPRRRRWRRKAGNDRLKNLNGTSNYLEGERIRIRILALFST